MFKELGIFFKYMASFAFIVIILAIAAILEVFWSSWWVYILTIHYVSWYDFYFGVYSVTIH